MSTAEPAEGAPGEPAGLDAKPVLEWTAEDWRQWSERAVEPGPGPGRPAPGSTRPATEVGPEPAVATEPEPPTTDATPAPAPGGALVGVVEEEDGWWSYRPDRPAPEPPAGSADVTVPRQPEPAPPPSPPRALQPRSGPAHRRQPVRRGELAPAHRARSAVGLLAVAMMVGMVVASMITVVVFLASIVLQRAAG